VARFAKLSLVIKYYREALFSLLVGAAFVITVWTELDDLSQKTRIYELIGQINEIQWRSAQIREELITIRNQVSQLTVSNRAQTDSEIATISGFLTANIGGLLAQPFLQPLITDQDKAYFRSLSAYFERNITLISRGNEIDYDELSRNVDYFLPEVRRITTLVNTASYIQAKAAEQAKGSSINHLIYSLIGCLLFISIIWAAFIYYTRARYNESVRQFSLLFAHMTVTRINGLKWWADNCLSADFPCDENLLHKARARIDHLSVMIQWLTHVAYPGDNTASSNTASLSDIAAELSSKVQEPKPRFSLAPDAANAVVNVPHLRLVLEELISNARDALEQSNGPVIGIYAHLARSFWRGNYLVVAIVDNGPGMTDEQIRLASSPFYSTKKDSRGHSGLGLYGCIQLVRAMNGKFRITSRPGSGTRMEFTCPMA